MTWKINIYSDMGEGYGRRRLGPCEGLIPLVPTVDIACGFHAGGPRITRRVTARAMEADVDVGALNAFVRAEGGAMRRVEPHGSLYAMCVERLADEDVEIVGFTPALAEFTPAAAA